MFKAQKVFTNEVEHFLIKSGFSNVQRIQLLPILVDQPNLYRLFEENCAYLLSKKCALSTTQITKITCKTNSYLNLRAFIKYYGDIRGMGLEFSKVLMILESQEANNIFPVLHKWLPKLIQHKLNLKQIQFIFEMIDNESQIEQVRPYLDDLIKLKFHKEHLQYIISLDLLEKTIEVYRKGIEVGFKTKEIYMMFNPDREHEELKKIIEHYAEFKNYGLSNCDMINIVVQFNNIQLIEVIADKFPKLIGEYFSTRKLLTILCSNNGIDNLDMLHKLSTKLINLRFTCDEIIKMANHDDGAFRLQALSTRAPELTLLKYTHIKILSVVLEEIENPESALYQDDISKYLKEIDQERTAHNVTELFEPNIFSFFASKISCEESVESLNMALEDFDSRISINNT
ncbi:MAG: hypothetical protein EBQ95_01410 [Gammaproteobacteria bacterium]|nr:hypothetical protein [Gammaproteobacteria bacterium]